MTGPRYCIDFGTITQQQLAYLDMSIAGSIVLHIHKGNINISQTQTTTLITEYEYEIMIPIIHINSCTI